MDWSTNKKSASRHPTSVEQSHCTGPAQPWSYWVVQHTAYVHYVFLSISSARDCRGDSNNKSSSLQTLLSVCDVCCSGRVLWGPVVWNVQARTIFVLVPLHLKKTKKFLGSWGVCIRFNFWLVLLVLNDGCLFLSYVIETPSFYICVYVGFMELSGRFFLQLKGFVFILTLLSFIYCYSERVWDGTVFYMCVLDMFCVAAVF